MTTSKPDQEKFFSALAARVNSDPRLVHRGRYLDGVIGWGFDNDLWVIHVVRGKIAAVDRPGEASALPNFSVSAPASIWGEFSTQYPRPGRHDILAMVDERLATVEGDVLPFFANMFYVKGLFAKLREDRSAS
jgi:hypothetical protein